MPVYAVENGVVSNVWFDVKTVAEFAKKYGDEQTVFEGSATPGEKVVNGKPVASEPVVDQVKAEALLDLKGRHADFLRLLTGNYSKEERDTWPEQKAWALSYESDQAAAAHLAGMLTQSQHQALVAAGQDPATFMAAKILGKAKAFADHTTNANRLRNEAVEAIAAAGTVQQVQDALAAFEGQVLAALDGQAAN